MATHVEQDDKAPNAPVLDRTVWQITIALAVAVTLVFSAFVFFFARYGEEFVRRRDHTVGEVLMREGMRLEESGMDALALETYERALNARFHGLHHRTFTLQQAGLLLWRAGRHEEAANHLERSLEGPGSTTKPYEGLLDALIHLGKLEEAQRYLADWNEKISMLVQGDEHEKACYAAGLLAEAQGLSKEALDLYEQCVNNHASASSAGRLGQLYADQGENRKAIFYLERYFQLGAPGENMMTLLDVYSWLLRDAAE